MDASGFGVGFLVVGAGFLGAQRAAAAMAARGCRLMAVHDCDTRAAQDVASQHGVRVAEDFEAALESDAVDAVVIATPHADHYHQVRLALEAGKHVLCEKPLAIRPDHARVLALRADELRLRLATGLNHRFYPPVRDALVLASRWAMGRVEEVRAEIGHRAAPEFLASWHTDAGRSGGGTLMDNGPHACDLVRRFLGEVVTARGALQNFVRPGCEMDAHAVFTNGEGGTGTVRSTWTNPEGYLTVEVRGSAGYLRIETAPWRLTGVLEGGMRVSKRYLTERLAERRFRGLFGCERSLVRELEAFVATPWGQPRLEATGWDGCRVTEMVDAVYQSDQTGTEVALKPPLVPFAARWRRRVGQEQTI
jgi:predicted dehydrogenase